MQIILFEFLQCRAHFTRRAFSKETDRDIADTVINIDHSTVGVSIFSRIFSTSNGSGVPLLEIVSVTVRPPVRG